MSDDLIGFSCRGESRPSQKVGQVDELLVSLGGLSNCCGTVVSEFLRLIYGHQDRNFASSEFGRKIFLFIEQAVVGGGESSAELFAQDNRVYLQSNAAIPTLARHVIDARTEIQATQNALPFM